MSGSLNQVNLIGHLGADPESRSMPSGDAVANIRIATSESWKDKQTGEKKERTEWHTVVFFGRLAEVVIEYLRKGALVYVGGSLRTRKWTDKDGRDRYSTEIVAGEMKMLGGRKNEEGTAPAPRSTSHAPQQPAAAGTSAGQADFDDDIPF